jgi:HK97 family phage prohead protease
MRELRTVALQAPEVRAATEGDTDVLEFTGHAAVFNEKTWIGPKRWGFWEEVDPGFFRDVLGDPAAFLINHDPNMLLARNGNTMTLTVDERGLVPDAQWDAADPEAQMWAGRVRRGDITQMSFAFDVAEDSWHFNEDSGEETRTLLRASALYDVSLVTYPAYSGTDGAMRDAAAAEVVRRHRGYDPRTEEPTTGRRRASAGPSLEARQRRHAALAKRYRLPLADPAS